MTAKQINSLLTVTAAACCVLAALALLAGLLLPIDSIFDPPVRRLSTASLPAHGQTTAPSIDSRETLWSRTFRASLTDGAPGAASSEATAAGIAQPQSFSLAGTIGDSLALIRLPDGSIVARAVGEDVAGAGSVIAITPRGVELSINGKSVLLAKPQPATSTGALIERAS